MTLDLSSDDLEMLDGRDGAAIEMSMRIIVRLAETVKAKRLIDISSAHIDSCLYHGPSTIDFADRLVQLGAQVKVPTTLNVSSMDLLHPDLYRGDPEEALRGRQLADLYESMGCKPTWTCAPYLLEERPNFGDQIVWAESNAIVFANSVLGARTDRYGDLIDICAAITGRTPDAGLHLDANRYASLVYEVGHLPSSLFDHDEIFPLLGAFIGSTTGTQVPVVDGLNHLQSEYRLRALGAAAASTGSVGMFHVVGSTPEAPTLDTALGNNTPQDIIKVSLEDLQMMRSKLTSSTGTALGTIALGTPHYSIDEFAILRSHILGNHKHPEIDFYVSAGRDVLLELELRGWADEFRSFGISLVSDTCTYFTPILSNTDKPAMTDSGKWAYYAPSNLGVEVIFASTADCVVSAIAGTVILNESIWTNEQ